MPVEFEISVVQVGKSLKVTIPVELAKHIGVKRGDKIIMYADNSHLVIKQKTEKKEN